MNLIVIQALYKKEIKRFFKVYNQTIIAPIVNALLFFNIFTLAFMRSSQTDVPYNIIVATGLIIMSALQNSYANSSSSISMAKVLGFITDYIIPSLTRSEILVASVLGAVTRGLLVGVLVYLALVFFVKITIFSVVFLFLFTFLGCLAFALLGVIFGSMSSNFDKAHAFQSYIIMPLTFLSGTFYSPQNLPEFWQAIIKLNPVFYMIDGFRYSLTGFHESNILFGLGVLCFLNVALYLVCMEVIKRFFTSK